MDAWKLKAHRIIGNVCRASMLAANPPGRKRHTPYAVPELAADLIACLNRDDEHGAKALFLTYDGLAAI